MFAIHSHSYAVGAGSVMHSLDAAAAEDWRLYLDTFSATSS